MDMVRLIKEWYALEQTSRVVMVIVGCEDNAQITLGTFGLYRSV